MNKVYLMDCMEGMRGTPDKYYDLACIDPNYGIGVNHNMGRRKGDKKSQYKPAVWDKESVSEELLDEVFRVSKNQIIWGANHFISKMPYDSSCWLMWDKLFSEDVTFAQFELAWTSFNSTCKKFTIHPSQINRIHPTQKPIALYDWIFAKYATKGMKILDTHAGSMSSVISAMKNEMQITAYEIDSDYFNAGKKRIENYLMQGDMFNQPKIEFIS